MTLKNLIDAAFDKYVSTEPFHYEVSKVIALKAWEGWMWR